MIKGRVVAGSFSELIVRIKGGEEMELGELLIADAQAGQVLLQVIDLQYGSQISQQNLELIAGLDLEEGEEPNFMDAKLRNYRLAVLKPVIVIAKSKASLAKVMPSFFSTVRAITKEDMSFLTTPREPLYIGDLRSGSRTLDVKVFLPAIEVLSHHILIAGTTGKGKSVLMKNLLWDCIGRVGLLIFDPHDEYYGRNQPGLKDVQDRGKVIYYTTRDPPPGQLTLKLNLNDLRPEHFACLDFSSPQMQAMHAYYRRYGDDWIEAVAMERELGVSVHEQSLGVVKRRMLQLLDIDVEETGIICQGIFDSKAGATTLADIARAAEEAKAIIIDTSHVSGQVELLVASIITSKVYHRYRRHKMDGVLASKPPIAVVLEEAPRVLGREVLEAGPNVFSTIAREGRKFKTGIVAITQLPSLIPKEILANMNTKIILGIEMASERQAIIESASQDLSQEQRSIASLDRGEAIVSSNFGRFAYPVRIPFFDDRVKAQAAPRKAFEGVSLGAAR
ncbi:MAG: DUF87 domain-containing protein [Nanoarchaeota archaeon]